MKDYSKMASIFKAISDPNRIMIVDMLSCGELCACMILENFNILQPTLSHHMKILCASGLVCGRKEGKWMHYSLVHEKFAEMTEIIAEISKDKQDCICKAQKDCC